MDAIQNELQAEYPALDIQVLAVNEYGQEQGNSVAAVGRDLPLLQDEDANHDGESDVWTSWEAEWRDLVVVDAQMQRVGVFNLTTYNLANPDNYAAAKQILVGVAQGKAFWQNPSNPLDVSGDGQMTPIDDVLRLINELNFPTITDQGRLPLPMPPSRPAPYFDVNGDGFLSAASDILPVINFFNRSAGEGEGSHDGDDVNVDELRAATTLPSWSTRYQFNDQAVLSTTSQLSRSPSLSGVEAIASLVAAEVGETKKRQLEFARAWDERPAELLDALEELLPAPPGRPDFSSPPREAHRGAEEFISTRSR